MLGFVKKKIGDWSEKQALEKMETFLRFIRSASGNEAAMTFLAASSVAAFAKQSAALRPFPADVLNGIRLADTPEEKGDLSFYILDLIQLQKQCMAAGTGKGHFMASGAVVLQHSVKAVQFPERLLAPGREMWKELMRGLDWIGDTLDRGDDLEFQEVFSEVLQLRTAEEFFFVPTMLVPDWKGAEHWSKKYETPKGGN